MSVLSSVKDHTGQLCHPLTFRTCRISSNVSCTEVRSASDVCVSSLCPPQAFYPVNTELSVQYGDTVAARCVFTGEGRTSETVIG